MCLVCVNGRNIGIFDFGGGVGGGGGGVAGSFADAGDIRNAAAQQKRGDIGGDGATGDGCADRGFVAFGAGATIEFGGDSGSDFAGRGGIYRVSGVGKSESQSRTSRSGASYSAVAAKRSGDEFFKPASLYFLGDHRGADRDAGVAIEPSGGDFVGVGILLSAGGLESGDCPDGGPVERIFEQRRLCLVDKGIRGGIVVICGAFCPAGDRAFDRGVKKERRTPLLSFYVFKALK